MSGAESEGVSPAVVVVPLLAFMTFVMTLTNMAGLTSLPWIGVFLPIIAPWLFFAVLFMGYLPFLVTQAIITKKEK